MNLLGALVLGIEYPNFGIIFDFDGVLYYSIKWFYPLGEIRHYIIRDYSAEYIKKHLKIKVLKE